MKSRKPIGLTIFVAACFWTGTHLLCAQPAPGGAPPGENQPVPPEFPPHTKIFQGYEEVESLDREGRPSLLSIWVRRKDGQMLAALPAKFDKQKYFIAMTVASGEQFAGLQAGETYVYWRRYGNRLALIEPNLEIRSNGDSESRSSVNRLFTDRVILDVPILTMLPKYGPVIDMDELLLGSASRFFGGSRFGSGGMYGINSRLASIKTAKPFEKNVELGFEVPTGGGVLKTLHYSISVIEENSKYQPRVADERVGYFTTHYSDYGKYERGQTRVRYINRWHLEKADPKLKLSPPKESIKFYIEHTTPIRYRRWVREGILMWNKAFAEIGIDNAIEVFYQDATTGAHMEKDPEDVQFNFVRWLNNDVSTAIGPSRVNPITGEILDADIILTDGWIRHFWHQFKKVMPELAMESFGPETLSWLEQRPEWDPRIRMAHPAERARLIAERQARGPQAYGGHPLAAQEHNHYGEDNEGALVGNLGQKNGLCNAAECRALDMAVMRFHWGLINRADEAEGTDGEKKEPVSELDGIPESFVGPLLADLVAHEVGHTLGLRHNFKSSSIYSNEQINSDEIKGKKPFAGSVMDYLPVNFFMKQGTLQGDYGMIDIGPYDRWAIQYGYSILKSPDELKPILARVAEPELAYATDEDTFGPDPLARRYDFGSDPIAYARTQMELARYHRQRLLEKFVEEGESWSKAREGYEMTLSLQIRSLSMMANWLGGAFIHRDKKGDPNGRPPITAVDASLQRDALDFVLNNSFPDEAYNLTPELLQRLTLDKWWDNSWTIYEDSTWPVHDRIASIQSSVLTMILNPTTLGWVYDNEFLVPSDQDALTLPELLTATKDSIWKEIVDCQDKTEYSARTPLISSLRRNLQREHLERLIDLSMAKGYGISAKPISNLALHQIQELATQIQTLLDKKELTLDPYSRSHLEEAKLRITKAVDAQYIYNTDDLGGGGFGGIIFLKEGERGAQDRQER